MNPKCGHCPLLAEDGPCPGQRNRRVCEREDAASPVHSPGIARKLLNFAVAAVQHVAAGAPMATAEAKTERLGICQACEHFENGGCKLCGCSMDMKAGWADSSCPLDSPKWGPVASE
jgi:hypothetical protein